MIHKRLGRVAVVAFVLCMTAAAPITAAEAVPAAYVASNTNCTLQGFLDDGGGTGSAASLQPGVTPAAGLEFYQETTGAWQLCYDLFGRLTLFAHQEQWCMADNNNNAELRPCNSNLDQKWSLNCASGGCIVMNGGGNVLCAGGSVGAEDFVNPPASCSSYHEHWHFESTS
jgi:hypothetical protein